MLLRVVFVFLLAMQIPVRFRYRIERRQARWNVVFPELSSANFTADSPAQARTEAPEKALTALARLLLKGSEAVPVCQRAHAGEGEAVLPLFAQGKARFIERAWALQVQAADVARALGITRQEAARLFDLAHPTKIDALSKALEVLGAQLDLSLSLLPQGPSRYSMKSPGADEHQSQPQLPMMPRAPEADQPQRSLEAGESALSEVSRRFVFESFNKDIEIFINLDHTRRIVCGIVFNHPFADNVVDAAALGIPS